MKNFDKVKEKMELKDFLEDKDIFCSAIRRARGVSGTHCSGGDLTCENCERWLKQEYKEPILDDAEREYLSVVIKPFKDIVEYIEKMCIDEELEGICISINCLYGDVFLPPFVIGTMYIGMELNKEYTLKELGL